MSWESLRISNLTICCSSKHDWQRTRTRTLRLSRTCTQVNPGSLMRVELRSWFIDAGFPCFLVEPCRSSWVTLSQWVQILTGNPGGPGKPGCPGRPCRHQTDWEHNPRHQAVQQHRQQQFYPRAFQSRTSCLSSWTLVDRTSSEVKQWAQTEPQQNPSVPEKCNQQSSLIRLLPFLQRSPGGLHSQGSQPHQEVRRSLGSLLHPADRGRVDKV